MRTALLTALLLLAIGRAFAGEIDPKDSLLYFYFPLGLENHAAAGGSLKLTNGAKIEKDLALHFSANDQAAELDAEGTKAMTRALGEAKALSVGGWFYCRRNAEQTFVRRGKLEVGELGELFFRPSEAYVNFCMGTDRHGFLMGTINGNGSMPFPHVTINEVPIVTWQQLVVVKDEGGHHHFYQNGGKVHDDTGSLWAPSKQPWRETAEGEEQPLVLSMPAGGKMGEVWIFPRTLSEQEIAADYKQKRTMYKPAPPPEKVLIREMHTQPPAEKTFDADRARKAMLDIFGPFPKEMVPLDPHVLGEEDCGSYVRRKVSLQVQQDDRLPAYMLIPKKITGRVPAVICFYGTTSGAGKHTTVGLSGRKPGDPPHANLRFAIDIAEAGMVAFAADYLRDGERIQPGDRPYDTKRFYEKLPDWSIHGKDAWDTMRAIDYLQTLDFIDGERIGMVGHSYGGHSTIFTSAFEPRIKVAVANGPVSAFREHGMHWAVPMGARASQSLPNMRPYILDPELPLPITFAEITALIAPRPLLVGQAVGERRPLEEQNAALVQSVYRDAKAADRARYVWYAGDHDFPPEMRAAAVDWFQKWFQE